MSASSSAYWSTVGSGLFVGLAICLAGRRLPVDRALILSRAISLLLAADAVVFVLRPVFAGSWSAASSLPLALCDVALVVAAIACWSPDWQLGVELTYFWGLAGTAQALLTPDLTARFPQLEFFEFIVGHVGIVVAALFLVIALRSAPRRGSVPRVFAITVGYTAFVATMDALLNANYMYLARLPGHGSLLSLLGPWPWYLLGAAVIAYGLLLLLDLPFSASLRL